MSRCPAVQREAPDQPIDEVYDIYAQNKGSGAEADWHQAPIVYASLPLSFAEADPNCQLHYMCRGSSPACKPDPHIGLKACLPECRYMMSWCLKMS